MKQHTLMLVSSAVGILTIVFAILSPKIWESINYNLGSIDPRKVKLVVGVISSLENQDRRSAIRKTWKKLSTGPPHSSVYFVMTDKSCPIDPFWRITESVCSEWRVRVPPHTDERATLRPLMVVSTNTRPWPGRDGLGFRTKFPVSILQLGLSKKFLVEYFSAMSTQNVVNVTVEFYDQQSGDILSTANYSREYLGSSFSADDGYFYHTIEEQMLPRSFEGVVRISQHNLMNPKETKSEIKDAKNTDISIRKRTFKLDRLFCTVHWNPIFGEDGVIVWSNLLKEGKFLPFTDQSCPLVSLVYQVPDVFELKQVVSSQTTQNKCQENKILNLGSKIVEEMEDHEDDVFFASGSDLIDVKGSNPALAISFMKWISEEKDFEYLFLTEDTSFVAINKVLSRLETQDIEDGLTWRSKFSFYEPVKYFGRDSEQSYVSQTYPTKPSQAGSLLSKDLVDVLVRHAEDLKSFSSLSASLSIWLAPFAPTYIEDQGFSADNGTCSKSSVAVAPYSNKEEMLNAWDNYKDCGRICHCKK